MPMPLEIIGLGKSTLTLVWAEDDRVDLTVRGLRVACVCAMCQSEATGERILDPESISSDITITDMALVGNYGLSIHFSDGHTTGIYRLANLYEQTRAA